MTSGSLDAATWPVPGMSRTPVSRRPVNSSADRVHVVLGHAQVECLRIPLAKQVLRVHRPLVRHGQLSLPRMPLISRQSRLRSSGAVRAWYADKRAGDANFQRCKARLSALVSA